MEDEKKILKRYGYTLERTLGSGSSAKVISAYSRELKRKVALKIIDRTKAPADFLQRFLPRELDILSSLNHPHIVKTLKNFEIGAKLFIVMELGERGDLLRFINTEGKLSEDLSKKMFRQIALAVKFIHDQDIVHRDLKCENLLLDKDINVKLADFGFSKRLEYVDGHMVLSDTFCGSMAYASPELLQNMPYNPKPNDVWSMGVVLFIMLTGTMPFNDSSLRARLKIQKKHGIKFPKSIKDKYKDAHDLISCMLDPDPARRIDIDRILEHPWLREDSAPAKGTQKRWRVLSTSKAGTKHAEHKRAKKPPADTGNHSSNSAAVPPSSPNPPKAKRPFL